MSFLSVECLWRSQCFTVYGRWSNTQVLSSTPKTLGHSSCLIMAQMEGSCIVFLEILRKPLKNFDNLTYPIQLLATLNWGYTILLDVDIKIKTEQNLTSA